MKNNSINPQILNALSVFEAAAKSSSFTLAAQSLGMAQPSVSRFIAILESQTGTQLFDRQHNKVLLTPQGEQLYEATALGLGHIRSVLQELSLNNDDDTLSICCTHGFAHMWVQPRVDRLKARLLEQEIRIITSDHPVDTVVSEDQLVIRFGNGDWPDTNALLLFKEEAFAVCSPEYAQTHCLIDGNLSIEEFAELPLLHQDLGEYGWLSWAGWFEAHGVKYRMPSPSPMINNYAFILQAAMEGKGIALAWNNLIEPYLTNEWLIKIPGYRVNTDKGYYLVAPANHPLADQIDAWIKETA